MPLEGATVPATETIDASQGPPSKRQKTQKKGTGQREAYWNDDSRKQAAKLPKKKFFRQRAHANVFSDHHLE
jgi:hypothetical protein